MHNACNAQQRLNAGVVLPVTLVLGVAYFGQRETDSERLQYQFDMSQLTYCGRENANFPLFNDGKQLKA